MKLIQWKTPNKMLFESEHKTFNKQTNLITTGNVWANTQRSSYIRPSNQTICNGFNRPIVELQNYDLENMSHILPQSTISAIKQLVDANNGGIVYAFFHVHKKRKILHGVILTDKAHNHLKTFVNPWYAPKSDSVLNECKKYICND